MSTTLIETLAVRRSRLWLNISVREDERALLWKNREFIGILSGGVYRYFDPFDQYQVQVVSRLQPWLTIPELAGLVKAGKLPEEEISVLDVGSNQRALTWVDDRFAGALEPGMHAWWNGMVAVRYELVNIRDKYGLLEHKEAVSIVPSLG